MTKQKTKENLLKIIEPDTELIVDKGDDSQAKPAPIEKLLKWRQQGLSYSEIGSLAGTSKQAAHKRLQPFKGAIESLPTYKEHRADIFAILQSMLLNSLTEADIKSMAPTSRITGAAILYDKERTERGLTGSQTSNSQVNVYMDFSGKTKEITGKVTK